MNDWITSWVSILLEGIPFLLVGAFFSGFLHAFQFFRFFRWMGSYRGFQGVLMGMGAGILLPLCECGSILIVRRLVTQGVPVGVAMAYFFSGAILNPITMLTTWTAYQGREPWEMLFARSICGGILVLVISMGFQRYQTYELFSPQKKDDMQDCIHQGNRWKVALLTMRHDFLLVLGLYVMGACFAAWVNTFVSWWKVAPYMEQPVLSPVISIFLAQGMSLCSTIDAFIGASLGQIPRHSQLAFLVAGPLFDLKLLVMYLMLFKPKIVFKIWGAVTGGTLLLAWIYRLLLE